LNHKVCDATQFMADFHPVLGAVDLAVEPNDRGGFPAQGDSAALRRKVTFSLFVGFLEREGLGSETLGGRLARRDPRWLLGRWIERGPVGLELEQRAVGYGHVARGALPPLRRDEWSGREGRALRTFFAPFLFCHGRPYPAPAAESISLGGQMPRLLARRGIAWRMLWRATTFFAGRSATKGIRVKKEGGCLARRDPRWLLERVLERGPVGLECEQCAVARALERRGALPPLRHDCGRELMGFIEWPATLQRSWQTLVPCLGRALARQAECKGRFLSRVNPVAPRAEIASLLTSTDRIRPFPS
jgi:hypothetical protein